MRCVGWGAVVSAMALGVPTRPLALGAQVAPAAKPTPLILEKNEGERRVWRPLMHGAATVKDLPSGFILKVDQHNGGSSHLVFGTEDLGPRAHIDAHRHPGADEILLLASGTARVTVGTLVRVVHAGATVFVPADTWVSVVNIGPDVIGLAYIFSAPGFNDFMRKESVPEGEKVVPLTKAEDAVILKEHSNAVVYRQA